MVLILFEASWEDYFCKCKARLEKFKKEDGMRYPENRLFFTSEKQINEEFKKALDEVKKEAGFIPSEVYISTKSDGELAVNLGATLLQVEIHFQMTLDVRRVSRRRHNQKKPFSFERHLAEEYDRCIFEYERVRREMKSTWKASDVSPGELDRAIRSVEEERKKAFEKLSAFRRNHCTMAAIKQAELEFANMNLLLKKLGEHYPRRA